VDPCSSAELRELARLVRRALRRLPPHLREILLLRYVDGLSYEELAENLGIALGSVRSRLHRARAALGERVGSILEAHVEAQTPRARVQ
jgi:RNA polymerase sigma-70 factor (ECF subfamily)